MPKHDIKNQPKLTKGCKRVMEVLQKTTHLTTAQDIHGILRKKDNVAPGLTTVYRSLDSLVDLELVQAVDLGDGEKRYELITPGDHHHHVICNTCHHSIHLDQCLVDTLIHQVEKQHGFSVRSHVLELFGMCADCQSTAKPKDRRMQRKM